MRTRFERDAAFPPTFMIDGDFIRALAADYVMSTGILLGVGLALAFGTQNRRLFRYRNDGIRGIRAFSGMLLTAAIVVLGIPWFALV